MSAATDKGVLAVIRKVATFIGGYIADDLAIVESTVAELIEAAKAAIAYDAAIKSAANDPAAMSSYCTAQGDTLDTLYADWIEKSRAALARCNGGAA
jgi:hypothetical protein